MSESDRPPSSAVADRRPWPALWIGAALGALVPLTAWLLEAALRGAALTPARVWELHRFNPAAWLLDAAPLAAGLVAYRLAREAGRRRQAEAALREAEQGLRQSAEQRRLLAQEADRLLQLNTSITGAMSEGLVLEDPDGRMTLVNPALLRLLDYTAEEVIGQHWSVIVAPDSRALVEELSALRPGGVASTYEARLLAKDGYEVPVLVSAAPLTRDGHYAGAVAILVNIADRLRQEASLQRVNDQLTRSLSELQQRNQEISQLNELSGTLQACLNVEEAQAAIARLLPRLFPGTAGAVYVNDTARGRADLAAAWEDETAFANSLGPDDCWGLRRGRLCLTAPGQADPVCRHLVAPAARAAVCAPLLTQSEAMGLLVLQQAETGLTFTEAGLRLAQAAADSLALALANLHLRETLRQQSIRDPLTGMFNRRYMEESLERELRRAARRGYPVGVIMLDIDHFKQFNDSFGHGAGDRLLQTVGEFLRVHIRAGDVACRYGGEEFLLLLPEASPQVTRQRAEHLREEIHHLRPEYRGQRLGPVTVSAGVAAYPVHGQTAEAVVRAADDALYAAKRLGRDRVSAAQPESVD